MPIADLDRIQLDLETLIAIESVTGNESPIQDVISELMMHAGLDVERLVVPLADVQDDETFPGTEVERSELPIVAGRLRGHKPGPDTDAVWPCGRCAAWRPRHLDDARLPADHT